MDKALDQNSKFGKTRLGGSVNQLFWLFILFHLVSWTVVPCFVRYNLPLDSIEGAIWGHQLEWGYDKNPFLNGWLTALALKLSHHQDWSIYLFSQLSVVICFIAVFQLAKKMLTPAAALASVVILEALQYYNFHAIDFNDNTLELSTWALCTFCFYQAIAPQTRATQRTFYWLCTAVMAALAMMAKYYSLALLAALGIFLLFEPEARKAWRSKAIYFALILFLLLLVPHVLWLTQHQYVTVHYVFERTQSLNTFWNHLFFPAQFALEQFEVVLPALVILGLLFFYEWLADRKTNQKEALNHLSSFNRRFLWIIGLGPFLLTLVLGLFFGIRLRAGWGMPLFSLIGILLIASPLFKPSIQSVLRLYKCMFIFIALTLGAYTFSLTRLDTTSSATFPGKSLAKEITARWHQQFDKPLAYVAGPRFLGGNVLVYSPDHPAVFMEWNAIKSPWIQKDRLLEKGGIVIWDKSKNFDPKIPQEYQDIPYYKEEILSLNWHRSKNSRPIIIGLRYIAPKS